LAHPRIVVYDENLQFGCFSTFKGNIWRRSTPAGRRRGRHTLFDQISLVPFESAR